MENLDRVQGRAMRMINGLETRADEEGWMESGLPVLRRFRGDLITVLNGVKDYYENRGDQLSLKSTS